MAKLGLSCNLWEVLLLQIASTNSKPSQPKVHLSFERFTEDQMTTLANDCNNVIYVSKKYLQAL